MAPYAKKWSQTGMFLLARCVLCLFALLCFGWARPKPLQVNRAPVGREGMVTMAAVNGFPVVVAAEGERYPLTYRSNEQAWQLTSAAGNWKASEGGELEVAGRGMAVNTERAFRDCVLTGKFQLGDATPQLIFRSLDSRRFYAVDLSFQLSTGLATWWRTYPAYPNAIPRWQGHVMASIWKGSADGYQRMLGYRRKVGIYLSDTHPHQWYEVRVECVGPEILVFVEDQFVCAVKDDEYQVGLVGVGSRGGHRCRWKDLTVQGRPVQLKPAWSVVPDPPSAVAPKDLPPLDSTDLPSLGERWKLSFEHNPAVTWVDLGTNFDQLTAKNFWVGLSRSKDAGKTWSEKERLNLPYPSGRAYQPIKGKAGGVVFGANNPRELSDGSVGFTAFWRDKPDGPYNSDQVQFCRSTDGGKTWSMSPVDATEWARNESSWVELANGELLCVMRSNYETFLGASRSRDKGKTWSRVQPIIAYFNPSAPLLLRTRDGVLVLATRGWGLFTSVDNGYTWSLPTDIGSYTGGRSSAAMRELPDGRILVGGPVDPADRDRQTGVSAFITVDREGIIHPPPAAR